MQVGTPVAAIGSPFGEKQSLSVGVVSAIDRAIDSLTEFQISGAIQTDAAINPGNSGGPLVDGARPRDRRQPADQVALRRRRGRRLRGPRRRPLALARRAARGRRGPLRLPRRAVRAALPAARRALRPARSSRARGCRSSQPDGPGEKAGLRGGKGEVRFQDRAFSEGGDIVTRIEDRPIRDADDLSEAVQLFDPGQKVTLEVWRDGEKRKIELTLGERPLSATREPVRVSGVAFDLAHALREIVLPRLGAADGRAHARESVGGDVTFAIDAEAEAFLAGWVAANAPQMAFYSEDRGMVAPGEGEPEFVLIVDPIDGTRPALAGLEAACTSVALAPLGDGEPTMGDVVAGCVVEIKSGEWFDAAARRGLPRLAPDRAEREHRPRAAVLGLRLHAPARARGRRGDRRADRPLVARRRRLRPRLGDLRPHAHPHRPARRLRRAGRADGRRGPGHARGVRARRRRLGRQQLALRPRGRRAVPRRRAAP